MPIPSTISCWLLMSLSVMSHSTPRIMPVATRLPSRPSSTKLRQCWMQRPSMVTRWTNSMQWMTSCSQLRKPLRWVRLHAPTQPVSILRDVTSISSLGHRSPLTVKTRLARTQLMVGISTSVPMASSGTSSPVTVMSSVAVPASGVVRR